MNKLNINNIQKNKKLDITWSNIEKQGVLSKAKIAIAKHKASRKVIVGAKSTGKSIIPMVKSIVMFENDPYFNAYGFRKYKDKSVNMMSKLFSQSLSILNITNFNIPIPYELRSQSSSMYKMQDKRNMLKNQAFQFGSLEDISGSTDGGAPANGGYYGIITVDEPVVEKDANNPDKIPKVDEWKKDELILMDNLARFNINYETFTGNQVETEIYYTMNNWGDHPLTLECDKYLEEEKFLSFVFSRPIKDLLGNKELVNALFDDEKWVNDFMLNNTMMTYVPSNDTLYVRMTKFANPNNWSTRKVNGKSSLREQILSRAKKALIDNDMDELTIVIGTKSRPKIDKDMLSYDIKEFNNTTLDKLMKENYKPTSLNYSIDIDTSRVLTITPTFKMTKYYRVMGESYERKKEILFIDRQIELEAHGTGVIGELNDVYVKLLIRVMTKHYDKLETKPNGVIVSVDDKRKWYLHEIFKQRKSWMNTFRIYEQHGEFDIYHRQVWTSTGFNNKVLWNHEKNKPLENDINICIKRDINDDRRKTSGNTNYLDRIDSMENGFIPYLGTILRSK